VQTENLHPLRLRLLLEIERTGSISAAAGRCGIAQPSASMHLRTLEGAIGHRLVARGGRGSSLTAAGTVVASHAARVLGTLDSMHRDLDALDPRHGGDLLIAASLTPSVVLIPQILRRFCDFYPDVRVELRTLPSATVLRDVARAEADIGIAGEVRAEDQVIRTQILVDELIGIAPPGLLTLDGGAVSLGELARNTLLVGSEGSSTKILSERYLARAKYRPARVWVFDSYEAIKRAVARGVGVSFISRLLVREEIERGELVAFRVAGLEPMARPLHVVQSAFRELPPEAAEFLALLEDTVRGRSPRLPA
jgi:molybdate transport repressor ModE-like protein